MADGAEPHAAISIHALLAESDPGSGKQERPPQNFYPRSPCGERLLRVFMICPPRDFYPRSPCGERRAGRGHVANRHQISIHALLAESDCQDTYIGPLPSRFLSTLSLRRATVHFMRSWRITTFLSTLSLRRATCWARSRRQPSSNFYPRSPCGERLTSVLPTIPGPTISIHALLAESDWGPRWTECRHPPFLSTLSLRRATLSDLRALL